MGHRLDMIHIVNHYRIVDSTVRVECLTRHMYASVRDVVKSHGGKSKSKSESSSSKSKSSDSEIVKSIGCKSKCKSLGRKFKSSSSPSSQVSLS